jgi:tetratricopeptide (TPR) repeat protein
MAPEQLAAVDPPDARSDVYALGVLLFELWTLRPPFWGTPSEVRVAVEARRPPRPSSFAPVSRAIEDVILRALAKSPGDRWASVRVLRQALERALEHRAPSPTAAEIAPRDAGDASEGLRKETRVQRNLPLIAFVSQTDAKAVERELARLDAVITAVSGTNYVAVVDSDANETPLDHALAAARRIVALGISRGVLVDVAPLRVRLGGPTRRYHGAQLAQLAARLGDGRREGVVLTASVAAMLQPGRTAPLPSGDEVLLVDHDSDVSMAEASQAADVQPFVGRREAMATLVQSGRAALSGRTPTLVTIRGDAGIGKSRLANAVRHAMTVAVPAARVLAFRGQDPSVGDVDETIRAILRRLVSPSGMPVRRHEVREHLQARVGDAWPAVALTLGWIGRDAPELLLLAQAPGALRVAAIEATSRLIRRAAEQTPLVIVLDDAHLADATTLDAFELATLDRGGAVPLWICVLVRPSFEALRPAWGERAARAEALELAPLSGAAAEELCRTLLSPAENLPAQLVEMITARAQGNAMLLGELCRALKTEGIVRQERAGAWILETDRVDDWPQTPRLQWLAERELGRLPPDLASHAQLAALLGPKFAVADILGVMQVLEASPAAAQFPLDPKVALAQLDKAQILRVRERHHCEFRNAMLCEAMRAAIPDALRVELHRAAFEHYGQVPEERRRARLAFHAAEAGLREPAAMAYEALAADYLYRHRYVEAEGAYSRMLALVDGAPQRQAAHHGRGLARYRTGRYEDALEDLHQAHALAAELGDRRAQLTILLDEATVLDWLNNYRRSAELVDQATALAADDAEPVIAARVAMGRARSLWRLGTSAEARASLLEAVGRGEAAGAAGYESLIVSLLMLGAFLGDLGEIREAREVFDRVLALAHAQGDRFHELAALNNRRAVWIAEKDVARATADLHDQLDIGRALGLVLVELVGTYNLGELLYQAGYVEAARPHVERAVALAMRRSDLLPRPLARLLELRLLAFEGRWQEAQALGTAIAELHRSAQAQGRSDAELLPGEQVLLDAILLASTRGGDEAWAGVRERSRSCSEEQQSIEVIEMQALGALRVGDLAGARRSLEEALDVARGIPNIMEARLLRRLAWIDSHH